MFTAAREDCADEKRRLPSAAELRLFRHERGVTLAGPPGPVGEWSSDLDEAGSGIAVVVAEPIAASPSNEANVPGSDPHEYRCVARAKR
jgi:hypothetical protein